MYPNGYSQSYYALSSCNMHEASRSKNSVRSTNHVTNIFDKKSRKDIPTDKPHLHHFVPSTPHYITHFISE